MGGVDPVEVVSGNEIFSGYSQHFSFLKLNVG